MYKVCSYTLYTYIQTLYKTISINYLLYDVYVTGNVYNQEMMTIPNSLMKLHHYLILVINS